MGSYKSLTFIHFEDPLGRLVCCSCFHVKASKGVTSLTTSRTRSLFLLFANDQYTLTFTCDQPHLLLGPC